MSSIAPLSVIFTVGQLVGITLLAAAPLLTFAADNYLREIQEEAKRQATIPIINQPQSVLPPAEPVADAAAKRLNPGLDQAAFEKALRNALPKDRVADFARLTDANRQRLYAAYQTDSRVASISEQIARLAPKKP